MEKENEIKSTAVTPAEPDAGGRRALIARLHSLSGGKALNEILEQDRAMDLVRDLASSDLFWLIKKIGEDDALPILKMASTEQWEYLLDMELWEKDRLDLEEASLWLGRLMEADTERLVKWLYSRGEAMSYYYLARNIEVEVKRGDEAMDLPEDFFTFDNLLYIRVLDSEKEEAVKALLQEMASQDYERFQAVLLGLPGVLPAETEEGMYRMRNVRISEEGFLPFDEAQSVYTHMKAEALTGEAVPRRVEPALEPEEERDAPVPLTPVVHIREGGLLAESMGGISDAILLDRVRLEFAGLCNQVLSADGLPMNSPEDLAGVCRKTAGYVGLGLERVSGGDIAVSRETIRNNPILFLFRVGFGLALELKWDAERWLREAWFLRVELGADFWGEEWGGILRGLLLKRPRLGGGSRDGGEFGDFETLEEIEGCRKAIEDMKVLDRFMEALTLSHPLDRVLMRDPLFTYRVLLFNLWARRHLGLSAGFEPLSLEQARDLFRLIRTKGEGPPYEMADWGGVFVRELTALAAGFEPEDIRRLGEALGGVWGKFREEYAWVAAADLDGRYVKFLLTRPGREGDQA